MFIHYTSEDLLFSFKVKSFPQKAHNHSIVTIASMAKKDKKKKKDDAPKEKTAKELEEEKERRDALIKEY